VWFKSPTPPTQGQSRPLLVTVRRVALVPMSSRLHVSACRRLCSWDRTERVLEDERVFACAGCGSEWVASEPWTPIDHTGVVPDPVQEERRRRGRG
jgi:hypothetical protein